MSTPDVMATELAVKSFDFDPDATTATEIEWVDMRNFSRILVGFFRTVGSSAVTFKLMANSESDGSGTDVDIVTHAVGSEPDAVGDQIYLETDAQQIAQKAADAGETGVRYITAVVSVATGTDEGVVTYIRKAERAYDGLTADVVA